MTDEQCNEILRRLDSQETRLRLIEDALTAQSTTLLTVIAGQNEAREKNGLIERFFRHLQIDYKAAVAADAAETRHVAREVGHIVERIYAEWKDSGGKINGQLTELAGQLQVLVVGLADFRASEG